MLTLPQAIERYGKIENGVWKDESKWCVLYSPPTAIPWINSAAGTRVNHIYCNTDMKNALNFALTLIIERGLENEIESFDGCLMVRDVRGIAGLVSTHAYALAIDINASMNKLGDEPTISDKIVECFKQAGFLWGGDFSRKDGMHFQFANW